MGRSNTVLGLECTLSFCSMTTDTHRERTEDCSHRFILTRMDWSSTKGRLMGPMRFDCRCQDLVCEICVSRIDEDALGLIYPSTCLAFCTTIPYLGPRLESRSGCCEYRMFLIGSSSVALVDSFLEPIASQFFTLMIQGIILFPKTGPA